MKYSASDVKLEAPAARPRSKSGRISRAMKHVSEDEQVIAGYARKYYANFVAVKIGFPSEADKLKYHNRAWEWASDYCKTRYVEPISMQCNWVRRSLS